MKANGKSMNFGFSAVNAGQRQIMVEPQVIAVSTEGNFRITPPVSKVLGIAHGDYAMFISNIDAIDAAIINKDQTVVDFCEEQGLTLGSPEAAIALHKEFDMWALAKGIIEYDSKGNQKTTTERLTLKDKKKFVAQNFEVMLETAMSQAEEEVKEALSREGITKEEQIDILSAFVTPRELPKFKGSKTASSNAMTGVGVSLTFTDSNIWKQLKADMGDEATLKNRVYDVDLDNIQDVEIYDGYKTVTVKALVFGASADVEPSRVGKND